MSMRSPLGRVCGLGSAKEGVGHWWAERADYATVRDWIAFEITRDVQFQGLFAICSYIFLNPETARAGWSRAGVRGGD